MSSVLFGATTVEQLRQNMAALDVTLSEECIEEINTVHMEVRDPTLDTW
jgi:aryl-alcohol dehydrogenase-like predicted oxidoreductase